MPATLGLSHQVPKRAIVDGVWTQSSIGVLGALATCYSAILALGAAHGLPVGFGLVSAVEIFMLSIGTLTVVANGVRDTDMVAIGFMYVVVALAVFLSIFNERLMIEMVRSVWIITVFVLLGQRAKERTIDLTFYAVTLVVAVILILEIVDTDTYVSLFQPQKFFELTRGFQESEYNKTGLFAATAGFSGRFTFGLSAHRTASIFLEQVSNANFACVLSLYLVVRWSCISVAKKIFFLATIIAILLTTNARFASMMAIAILVGCPVFGRLPRWTMLFITVSIVLILVLVGFTRYDYANDDLIGRLAFTVRSVGRGDVWYFVGGRAASSLAIADSGYAYLIGTMSMFGFAIFWTFVNFYPRADEDISKRLAWSLLIYILGQLAVSGTSLLSIKTAALVWILVGFVKLQTPLNAQYIIRTAPSNGEK